MNKKLAYLSDRYHERLSRLSYIEQQGATLLIVATVIIIAVALIAIIQAGVLFHPAHPVGWLRLISLLLAVFALICAWGHALLTWRSGERWALPVERKTLACLDAENAEEASRHLCDDHLDAVERLAGELTNKQRFLGFAVEELTLSAWLLGLSAALSIYRILSE
ncbi:hypothetical protein [Zobellella aerophila]|uniref:Uncharacterized protein n=1 Tax=Zobellella aerophila TaxID=870480 RepID=A0ABP6V5E4_9GAMM